MESTAWLSLKYLHSAGPEVRSVLTDDEVRAGINKRLNHFKDLTCEMHDPSLEEEEKKRLRGFATSRTTGTSWACRVDSVAMGN